MNVPPGRHLHLHVISSDLCAPALETKRHYNSFSPRVGFFVPLDEVRAWFDDEQQQHELAKVSFACRKPLRFIRCSHVALSNCALLFCG